MTWVVITLSGEEPRSTLLLPAAKGEISIQTIPIAVEKGFDD
jgi:hypothetical protein